MKRRDFLIQSMLSSLATVAFHDFPVQSQPLYQTKQSYKSWKSDNSFLTGINAPVFQELDINNLKVSGTIPKELQGMYVRNGPNPMFKPSAYNYPLEGDGMLHGIYFNQGKVSYKNRWIQTSGLTYEMFEGKELSELKFKNYANTNIMAHGGKLLALYEIGLPYEINKDLETVGKWDFNGKLEQSMTAHPKVDPITGELHFYRYSFFNTPYLHYYIADKQGKIIRNYPIEISQPVLIHDMAITQNYAIFFQCPLAFNMQKAKENNTPFNWEPEAGSTIILVDRHNPNKKPIYIKTEAFWVWHFMNAYEQNNQVMIDYVYYPKMKLESNWQVILANKSNLQRMTIDLPTQKISQQPLDDHYIDFPVIDSRKLANPYRFGYAPHIDTELLSQKQLPNYFPALIQYDVVNQTQKIHQLKSGSYCGEPAFIPHPNKTSELDGYIVTLAYNENTNTSDLLIIDPANFEQEPIATVHLPVRVPSGFHGNWIPS
ncbi:carotenoid oxygenase family protein [Aphanothece sacrum]|uniref:Carotenoid oxygenase n=1 Tax=Aphanothece sacrum FPU1 TaxID=1920663 RepID=A0A401IMW8_APHSA|nr:carotenoid oxygenase family protein [Aphanothece sacrum]GBF82610.1 carotenoid oxygenase [Aphanothece sacrum FPU1]GBF84744.1 carotenoid oxygenase [Aphanothece sacrum FPU3]